MRAVMFGRLVAFRRIFLLAPSLRGFRFSQPGERRQIDGQERLTGDVGNRQGERRVIRVPLRRRMNLLHEGKRRHGDIIRPKQVFELSYFVRTEVGRLRLQQPAR